MYVCGVQGYIYMYLEGSGGMLPQGKFEFFLKVNLLSEHLVSQQLKCVCVGVQLRTLFAVFGSNLQTSHSGVHFYSSYYY